MADFCQQCSLGHFNKDFGDLKGLGDGRVLKEGYGWVALCEGCGMVVVDDNGKCLGNCLKPEHDNPKQRSKADEKESQ